MLTNSQPKLLPIPFSDSGAKQDIPNSSQIGITAGRASYPDGFPPLTRTPLAAGGVPPFGTDINGVLFDITSAIRWSQSGAGYSFNDSFNNTISGYPKGAKIPNSALDGFWLNTVDGNTVNPENLNGTLTGWVPSDSYGSVTISGLSGSGVTLTSLQAAKNKIILTGSLTSNINLVVPAWIKSWTIDNQCIGSFSVTVKTPNGTGVAILAGTMRKVYGDGVDIYFELGSASTRNVGTDANQIPDMSAFPFTKNDLGSQYLPSGMIIQWATVNSFDPSGWTLVNFQNAWPNKILGAMAINIAGSVLADKIMGVKRLTDKSLQITAISRSDGSPAGVGNAAHVIAWGW